MSSQNSNLTIIGVPLDLGAENLGVDIGPDAFRKNGIVDKLANSNFNISDSGDLSVRPRNELEVGDHHLKYLDEVVRVNNELAEKVEALVRDGQLVVVLGGDHSINLGAFSGASTALDYQLGLIYLDAHADMNTADTTLTGNIHGMHLASLMGFGSRELINVHSQHVKLAKKNLLHIGGSDFDAAEWQLIRDEQLNIFSLFDLLSDGLSPLIRKLDAFATQQTKVWVSLDLDSIDQLYAPAAAMPNAKGLTYREIATIAEYIGQHCSVIGVDVVEYNPLTDQNSKTAELGIELIAKLLGKNYSWYTNYLGRNKV